MAKGKYEEWLEPEGLLKIEGWARDGLTDEQIAHNMGVAYSTLRIWKDKYMALSAALKKGKEIVDREVENALLKRALGYSYTEITRERIIDTGQKNRHGGESELTEKEWEFAIKYFGGNCCYCGKKMEHPTKDHVIPLNSGGSLCRDNVVPCCKSCNSAKKDHNIIEWYKRQSFYDEHRLDKIYDYIRFVGELVEESTGELEELVVTKEVTKEVQPDVTAQIFWLKNRKPEEWRDKREVGLSGKIETDPYDGLSLEELRALAKKCEEDGNTS